MAQATFSVRMDQDLKKEFEKLCSTFGMNMTTAINIFAKAVVRERKIPFEISEKKDISREEMLLAIQALREKAKINGTSNITLEEINKEIELARKDNN